MKTISAAAQKAQPGDIVTWLHQPDIEVPQAPNPPRKPADDAPQAELDKYTATLADHKKAMETWTLQVKPEADRKQTEFNSAMAKTLEALSPQALRDNRIDAVIFCNTSGALPLPDLEGFANWVKSGGAFIGMHAGSDTLKDALPFTDMLCGTFDGHGPQVPATLNAGDKEHPANGNIGDIWTLSQEEMYLIKNQKRDQVRSVWFMRHHPNKPEEKGFFPVAWVRGLGDGRLAVLGHSMASDIIVRFAQAAPDVAATIAVSMFSPVVTATTPRNLLVITGEWEGMLKREALRAVADDANHPRARAARTLLYKVATLLPQAGIATE